MATPEIVAFEDWLPGQPAVKETLDSIQRMRESSCGPNFREIPGYIWSGRDKHAIRVGDYVLKIQVENPESSFASQIDPLQRALGVTGVEQLVAVSKSKQFKETMVTGFVPGSMPARLRSDALVQRYIKPASIEALRRTLHEMREAGIFIDGPTNLLADGKRFNVIDPVSDPQYGLNDFDGVAGLIAEQQLVAPGKIGDRSDKEYLQIWNAIQAQRRVLRNK